MGSRKKAGSLVLAHGLLDKAIAAYLKGFEADWRDAYPGVNAVTLMTLREPPDSRKDELVPIVAYAVKRRIATGKPDYWDCATLLELAVIEGMRPQQPTPWEMLLPLFGKSVSRRLLAGIGG